MLQKLLVKWKNTGVYGTIKFKQSVVNYVLDYPNGWLLNTLVSLTVQSTSGLENSKIIAIQSVLEEAIIMPIMILKKELKDIQSPKKDY